MNRPTSEELDALNAGFSEIRGGALCSVLQNRQRDIFYLTLGFALGVICVLVAFDVWLFFN